jgi:hypothetical protein
MILNESEVLAANTLTAEIGMEFRISLVLLQFSSVFSMSDVAWFSVVSYSRKGGLNDARLW